MDENASILWSGFQMTVESKYAIAISALSDWLKNRTPVFNQSEAKPKPIAPCTRVFFARF